MSTSKEALSGPGSRSSAGRIETVAVLFESTIPALYHRNAFRTLELPVDATAREISRRKQTIEKALNHNVQLPAGPGRYFPLIPPPDQSAVREAVQRLSDPERRIVDELFWFWPHRQGEATGDPALTYLREGKDTAAEGCWLEQEAEHSESSVSTHNLALLYHFRALENELNGWAISASMEQDRVAKTWDKSFRRWRSLASQESFWNRLASRIQELDDPRLTARSVRRIRSALPAALLSICGQLVLQAVEASRGESALRLVEIIKKSGFAESDIKEGIRLVVEPARERIKAFCKAAELASENDPIHANQACRQLLSSSKALLEGLDCLLPIDHPLRELSHDDVAKRLLRCQIAYAKKTENWNLSVGLLESALAVAASDSVRKELKDNLEVVRKRAETNDDFCGDGYYEAPELLVEQLEKAREMASRQDYDQAIKSLEDLLAGKSEVRISTEDLSLVSEALAYCLGSRAAKRMNEALGEWNDIKTTVISDIQGRVDKITDTAWRCASMETIPQYVTCPCMCCGTVIHGRYSILKWTFNKEKGPATLIICGACADRHRSQLGPARTKLKEAIRRSTQDYVDAGQLDPANRFVDVQIYSMRKMCSDMEVPMPSAQRHKVKAAKPASIQIPETGADTPLAAPSALRHLEGRSLGLGIFAAVWCVIVWNVAEALGWTNLWARFAVSIVPAGAAAIDGHFALRGTAAGRRPGHSRAAFAALIVGYGLLLIMLVVTMSVSTARSLKARQSEEAREAQARGRAIEARHSEEARKAEEARQVEDCSAGRRSARGR